jgi:hypothetical protein
MTGRRRLVLSSSRVVISSAPAALISIALALFALPILAQRDENRMYDRFELTASLADVILNSDVRVDGSNGNVGTDVDAEDDLGLAKSVLKPRFGFRWRPGRRHEIELAYLLTGRSADKTLSREIAFGDTTFTAGLRVHSQFDDSRLLLTYRFAIEARETWQFGVGVGLGAFFINPTLDALAGGESRNVDYSQSTSGIGPTASLGLYGRFLLSPTWYLETDARALAGSVDRYTVRIFEGGVALRHFITRQWGFEGAYGYSGIRLDVGPRTGLVSLASGRFKYSLQEVRLGVAFHP